MISNFVLLFVLELVSYDHESAQLNVFLTFDAVIYFVCYICAWATGSNANLKGSLTNVFRIIIWTELETKEVYLLR